LTLFSGGEGLGTTFTVTLPLLASGQQPASADINAAAQKAIPPDQPIRVKLNLRGLRVLVVEDEEDALQLMKMALGRLGAAVVTAASGNEALAVLGGMKPDALICDIGMPEMDGYELIRRVRALSPQQGGSIPAVALTAYAREEDKQKALAAGFQKHLAKPVTPDELATTVIDLCR
jgi:CheY-like chemotaxis protein